jgi:tRNA modification GTPase
VFFLSDTIAAVATGGGVSAIGVVRVSGDEALTVADSVFRPACGIRLIDAENRRMYFGELVGSNGGLIDLCLCTVSRAPASYTGEDTVEFFCHGSPVVLSEVLRVLFEKGVRHATPGEFTKRAFLNGRMDLTQAEAVIDLIESETLSAAKNAACQLRGAISVRMEAVYSSLIDVMAHFHAVLDYPDEDIDEFDLQNYMTILHGAIEELQRMIDTHERSRVLRDGIPTAIIGRPNTGKSSLLNAMLGYERAIVTSVAGTTRDTIEEKILFGGVLLRLIDTAGLRKTDDELEKLGVERAMAALRYAKLVILVLDGSEELTGEDFDALNIIPQDVSRIVVVNKTDLPLALVTDKLAELGVFGELGAGCCRVSALTGEGLDLLDAEIKRMFPVFGMSPSGELITNTRQADAIARAASHVRLAVESLTAAVTPDAVLTDIEAALDAIGEVTGRTIREDIISRVFERFCVGK